MNTQPLDEFAVEFGLVLAGLTVSNTEEDFEPLDPLQLEMVIYGAVATYARQRPDYDEDAVVSDSIILGISSYAHALSLVSDQLMDDILKEKPDGELELEPGTQDPSAAFPPLEDHAETDHSDRQDVTDAPGT